MDLAGAEDRSREHRVLQDFLGALEDIFEVEILLDALSDLGLGVQHGLDEARVVADLPQSQQEDENRKYRANQKAELQTLREKAKKLQTLQKDFDRILEVVDKYERQIHDFWARVPPS